MCRANNEKDEGPDRKSCDRPEWIKRLHYNNESNRCSLCSSSCVCFVLSFWCCHIKVEESYKDVPWNCYPAVGGLNAPHNDPLSRVCACQLLLKKWHRMSACSLLLSVSLSRSVEHPSVLNRKAFVWFVIITSATFVALWPFFFFIQLFRIYHQRKSKFHKHSLLLIGESGLALACLQTIKT